MTRALFRTGFFVAAAATVAAGQRAQHRPPDIHPPQEHFEEARREVPPFHQPQYQPVQRVASDLPAPMSLRCRQLMTMRIDPADPAAVLALGQQLDLSPDQQRRLARISAEARRRTRQVLDPGQLRQLEELQDTPETVLQMHQAMSSRVDSRGAEPPGPPTASDQQSAVCPMMRAIRRMNTAQPQAASDPLRHSDPAQGRKVRVIFREDAIDMPGEVPPGIIGFTLVNRARQPCVFLVEGPDTWEKAQEPLVPGEERLLKLHLRPGSYEVTCRPLRGLSPSRETFRVTSEGPSPAGK